MQIRIAQGKGKKDRYSLLSIRFLEVLRKYYSKYKPQEWLFEGVAGKDIDFVDHPAFSKKYYLRGENEIAVRDFFTEPIINFLKNREEMHIECHRHRLIFYKKRELLESGEILYAMKFAEEFLQLVQEKATQSV